MKRVFPWLMIALTLPGCATTLDNFDKSEFSGTKNNQVALALVDKDYLKEGNRKRPTRSFVDGDTALREIIEKECPPQEEPGAESLVPVAAALGKYAFDAFVDSQIKATETLKKAAFSVYSESVIIDEIEGFSCAIIARYTKDGAAREPGLIALIKINYVGGSAFTVSPRYIRAYNAAAITRRAGDDSHGEISLSVAIATKAIGKQLSGVKGLFATGDGVFSVPKISIGPDAAPFTCPDAMDGFESACPVSELVVYDLSNGHISITIAATEVGSIGADIDANLADLKALKEAIGPALKDSLKEYLD